MSLSDTQKSIRPLAVLAVALIAATALTGCLRPLYGTRNDGSSVKAELATIEITAISGRIGQRVRNALIFSLQQGAAAPAPVYRLELTVRNTTSSLLVRSSGEATSQVFTLIGDFKLYKRDGNTLAFEGEALAKASLDKYQSTFANIRAKRDAENRAARNLADLIRTRLAAYVARAH